MRPSGPLGTVRPQQSLFVAGDLVPFDRAVTGTTVTVRSGDNGDGDGGRETGDLMHSGDLNSGNI